MVLIRGSGTTAVDVHWLFCSVVAAVEEPSPMPEERVRVLNEPVRGSSDVEETEGRDGRNS